jgi:hypothetical protein
MLLYMTCSIGGGIWLLRKAIGISGCVLLHLVNWVDTVSGALFDFDFNQSRDGTKYSSAYNNETDFKFTAHSNHDGRSC